MARQVRPHAPSATGGLRARSDRTRAAETLNVLPEAGAVPVFPVLGPP